MHGTWHAYPYGYNRFYLYPKHIQVGEVREMFLLNRMPYKVLSAK